MPLKNHDKTSTGVQIPGQTIHQALDLLRQTDNREAVDCGFDMLLKLADEGDSTAAAHVGYASQFEHLGHYNLERCKEYLEKSVAANDSTGQFFLASMLMCGDAPFHEDKVYGKWLLEESKKGGNKDAENFLKAWYTELTQEEAKKMLVKSTLIIMWENVLDLFRGKYY